MVVGDDAREFRDFGLHQRPAIERRHARGFQDHDGAAAAIDQHAQLMSADVHFFAVAGFYCLRQQRGQGYQRDDQQDKQLVHDEDPEV